MNCKFLVCFYRGRKSLEKRSWWRRKFIEQFPKLTRARRARCQHGKIFHKTIEIPIQQRAEKDESSPTMFAPNNQLFYEFSSSSMVLLNPPESACLAAHADESLNGKDWESCASAGSGVKYANSLSSAIKVVFRCDNGKIFVSTFRTHTRRWRLRDAGSRSQLFAATQSRAAEIRLQVDEGAPVELPCVYNLESEL